MERRTEPWKSKRYIADYETLVVHDRLTGRCKAVLRDNLRRGVALGFVRDTLSTAIEWGYEPCPRCVPGCSKAKLVVAIPKPRRPLRPMPPLEWVVAPLAPRGPLLSAGNAVSMEGMLEEEKVQAA